MSGKTKELLGEMQRLFVLVAVVAVVVLAGIFFLAGYQLPANPDPERTAYVSYSFVMAITANLIPVFLLFVASFVALKKINRIQAEEEQTELAGLVKAAVTECVAAEKIGLASEVKAAVSAGIVQAGIPGGAPATAVAYSNFRDEPPWAALIENSSTIHIVVHYFDTWINQNQQALKTFFNRGGKLYMVLPDHTDGELVKLIQQRFPEQNKAVLESKIRNTFEKLKAIHDQCNRKDAGIEVAYVDFAPLYCAVQFDQRELVISAYEHNRKVAVASPAVMYYLGHFPAVREWFAKEYPFLTASTTKVKRV